MLGFISIAIEQSGVGSGPPVNRAYVHEQYEEYAISDEQALLAMLENAHGKIDQAIPLPAKNKILTKKMIGFISQPLRHSQRWADVLPTLHDDLLELVVRDPDQCPPIINLLAHVLPQLPPTALSSPHMMPLLSAVGCINALLDEQHAWEDYEYMKIAEKIPAFDRQGLNEIISNHFSGLGNDHAWEWWTGLSPQARKKFESIPQIASMFKAASLGHVANSSSTNRAPTTPRRAL